MELFSLQLAAAFAVVVVMAAESISNLIKEPRFDSFRAKFGRPAP